MNVQPIAKPGKDPLLISTAKAIPAKPIEEVKKPKRTNSVIGK